VRTRTLVDRDEAARLAPEEVPMKTKSKVKAGTSHHG